VHIIDKLSIYITVYIYTNKFNFKKEHWIWRMQNFDCKKYISKQDEHMELANIKIPILMIAVWNSIHSLLIIQQQSNRDLANFCVCQ